MSLPITFTAAQDYWGAFYDLEGLCSLSKPYIYSTNDSQNTTYYFNSECRCVACRAAARYLWMLPACIPAAPA